MRPIKAVGMVTALTLLVCAGMAHGATKPGKPSGKPAAKPPGIPARTTVPSMQKPSALFPISGDRGWGYIDKTGKLVIPAQFDYAADFRNSLAR